jgi:hypothetical protein
VLFYYFPAGEKADKMTYKAMARKKKVRIPDSERRRWPRLKPSSLPLLQKVALSQGTEVQAIDISRGGMLLETELRLRPLMKIHLKLVTSKGTIRVEGVVLRSMISSLSGGPKYRSAIAFEKPLNMLDELSDESAEAALSEFQPEPDSQQQEDSQVAPQPIIGAFDENTSILTFVEADMPGTNLLDRFGMNDW